MNTDRYADRREAGRELARVLGAPLDVLAVRKIGELDLVSDWHEAFEPPSERSRPTSAPDLGNPP